MSPPRSSSSSRRRPAPGAPRRKARDERMSAKPFRLGTTSLAPGERKTVDLPVSALSNHTPLTLPVHVIHGEKAGPVLFLSAVVHGDEILGAEIVRRVIRHRVVHNLAGTLLAVPVVNAFGLISHSRYM